LTFKKLIIDCLLKEWSQQDLALLVPKLHPMECVYVLVNSISTSSSEDIQHSHWFNDDSGKAYLVFEYIVRWINWKIEDGGADECYYETYFKDYGRQERLHIFDYRKRIMSSIGGDMLNYILNYPQSNATDRVVKSLKEIVPLLDNEILLVFWVFFGKLAQSQGGLY
jgi:hypothetical protein